LWDYPQTGYEVQVWAKPQPNGTMAVLIINSNQTGTRKKFCTDVCSFVCPRGFGGGTKKGFAPAIDTFTRVVGTRNRLLIFPWNDVTHHRIGTSQTTVALGKLNLTGRVSVRDVWQHTDNGTIVGSLTTGTDNIAPVAPASSMFLLLSPA
jgi:hypothetical protein